MFRLAHAHGNDGAFIDQAMDPFDGNVQRFGQVGQGQPVGY